MGDSIDITGVRVSLVGVEEIHHRMAQAVRANAKSFILNVNAHCLNLACRQRWLRDLLNGADILIVGFGMPLQERWLVENRVGLDVRVALAGGAVFDYVSGRLRRAPRLLTDHGFEWLGRLLIESRRLWRRYLVGNPVFLARVLRQRLFGSRSDRP